VRAGEVVTVSLAAANRDPEKFPRPDALDLRRSTSGHLAFSQGIHMCIGQHLARLELQIGLAGLLGRFPQLRLAVPVEEVPVFGLDYGFYRVRELLVAWGG
jgi:cytochrome P450